MAVERSLILVKPDGMKRRLSGIVVDRLDNAGFEMVAAKIVSVTEELAREHYALLKEMPFFPNLIQFIKGDFHGVSGRRVLALVYQGENAVKGIRAVVGATNPEQAAPGTIRGSFGRISQGNFENVVHASGNVEEAEREVKIWFKPEEVVG
ncbi:MAG: nucleoside-diphosphate kinase [Elusimicrobia bacterium]|nr:nucleoside-diphosphate kinase [Elusimicrobiota bacterium]